MKQKQAWTLYKKEEETAIEELCSGYRRFLDAGKTERECIKEAVRLAKKKRVSEIVGMQADQTGRQSICGAQLQDRGIFSDRNGFARNCISSISDHRGACGFAAVGCQTGSAL